MSGDDDEPAEGEGDKVGVGVGRLAAVVHRRGSAR